MGARVLSVVAAAVAATVLAIPVASGAKRSSSAFGDVAIFYYPWYSNPARDGRWAHWYVDRGGTPVLSTPFYPARGLYSSSSPRIVSAHMREIRDAGVRTVVVSWWGFGSPEHDRLPLVTEAARRHGLEVAVHVEPYARRTPARAAEDIARLRLEDGYTSFWVYDVDRDPAAEWADALDSLEDVVVLGHTVLPGRAKASGFDGLYTYDVVTWNGDTFRRLCTQAHAVGLLCAPSVGPGYDARLATRDPTVRPRKRGARYDHMWRAAVRSGADLVSITSYNEWQEGTQIEPAALQVGRRGYDGAWGKRGRAAGTAYLDVTARWIARFLEGISRQ